MKFVILSLAAVAFAHGDLTSPASRKRGPQMQKNCGQQVFNKDSKGNVQDYLATGRQQKDFNEKLCDLSMCRGATYQDNIENVQKYKAGQVVTIKYNIA